MAGKTDLPRAAVSPSVMARLALREIRKQEGVVRMRSTLLQWLRRRPGIKVRLDKEGYVHIRAAITVRYGENVREVGLLVQRAIGEALQRVSDRPIAEICVVIAATAP